jgi:hypothetical protein
VKSPFLGPAYVARSTNLADQQLINLFPVFVETQTGREIGAFYMTPGLTLLATIGPGPQRGMLVFGTLLYLVSGNSVYRVDVSFNATLCGTISSTTGPVSMIANGTQIAIFDGFNGYLVVGTTLTSLSLPFPSPTIAVYQDNFGLVLQGNTRTVWQSNVGDLNTWSALNFTTIDAQADLLVTVANLNDQVWFIKNTNTEVWQNAGLNGFAFQRIAGALIERGCWAPFSLAKTGDSLIWLARDAQGINTVVATSGYSVVPVSTEALSYELSSYSTTADAVAFAYQQEGHLFYQISFPTANKTWVFDVTASGRTKVPIWHQRASFAAGQFSRHLANDFALFNGLRVVGDYQNGNLYSYDLNVLTDNGAQRKWLRSWRATQQSASQPQRFSDLTITMETGAQVPDGTNPQLMLRYSDDGGHHWSNERFGSAGKTGETALRVKFNRLGSTKRNSGLDRIFELSSTDPFKVALLSAELN